MYFVMLRSQTGFPIVMLDYSDSEREDITAVFNTKEAAEFAAKLNPFGKTYGYKVYEF